jgi:hypothetical protein
MHKDVVSMTELLPQAVALDNEVYYPETDGEPMAESDSQCDPLIYAEARRLAEERIQALEAKLHL